jgi:hypothetical protein
MVGQAGERAVLEPYSCVTANLSCAAGRWIGACQGSLVGYCTSLSGWLLAGLLFAHRLSVQEEMRDLSTIIAHIL